MVDKLQAYVLKADRLSDSKWKVVLFSLERGRITAWLRLSKQVKFKLGVEPFVPLWVELQSSASSGFVKKIELLAAPTPLSGESLFAGWYIHELLFLLTLEEEADLPLYQLYEHTLNALRACNERDKLEMLLRHFEWQLLQCLGMGISLTHDARSGQVIQAEKFYQCLPQVGLVEAKSGLLGQVCLSLAQGQYPSKEMLKAAKQLTRILIDKALEGNVLKTRALFRSVYAK
jgi:DNA repair protein RecO (recombination protein O)